MARDFSKNTSNYMELGTNAIGPLLNGAAAISCHCWINADSYSGGSSDNVIFSIGISNTISFFILVDGSNWVLRIGGSSRSSDAFVQAVGTSYIIFQTGTWQSVGFVLDFQNSKIRIYRNGTQETNQSVTFHGSTYVHTTATGTVDRIGGPIGTLTTATQFDGRIAELALWKKDIGTDAFVQLNKRYSSLVVAPINSLAAYFPLFGNYSPEIDIRNSQLATINGTVAKADHTNIIYPKRRSWDGQAVGSSVSRIPFSPLIATSWSYLDEIEKY